MFCDVGSFGTGGTGRKCGSRICSMAMSSSFFVVWKPFIEVVSTLNLALLEPCACEEPKDWSLWSVDEAEFFVIVKPWFLAKRKETVQHYYQLNFSEIPTVPVKEKKSRIRLWLNHRQSFPSRIQRPQRKVFSSFLYDFGWVIREIL